VNQVAITRRLEMRFVNAAGRPVTLSVPDPPGKPDGGRGGDGDEHGHRQKHLHLHRRGPHRYRRGTHRGKGHHRPHRRL